MEMAQTEQKMTLGDLVKYLQVFTSPDIDWVKSINDIGKTISKDELRKRIAFTILLPVHEKYAFNNTDIQSFLRFCHKWSQFDSRDWWEDLEKVFKQDKHIEVVRNKCLGLGVIHPLQYNPTTRQARNWLVNEAQNSGDMTEENKADVSRRLENLVYAYGGRIISNVFEKPEWKPKLSRIHNWRSGYFIERLIYQVYPNEQDLIAIKTQELHKLRLADSKLIKSIK